MAELKRPFRVLTWGAPLLETKLLPWVGEAFDAVEVLVHTEAPEPDAKAELFTCPNHGLSVGDLITRAIAAGLRVIVNLDPHFGNGRDEDGGSATGAGRYQSGMAEGGVGPAVDRLLTWPDELLEHVIAVQFFNEPTNREWLAKWIAGFLERGYAGKVRRRGWDVVISASSFHAQYCAEFSDVLDPHLLFDSPADVGRAVGQLRTDHPGKEIWITELTAAQAIDTLEVTDAAIRAGAEAVSAFGGNTQDFKPGGVRWNFRRLPEFVCWTSEGLTTVGREWGEYFGVELNGGDEEPPPGDGPPVDPPADPCNCKRARIQNAKAIGALEAGRVEAALSILKRQAKALEPTDLSIPRL